MLTSCCCKFPVHILYLLCPGGEGRCILCGFCILLHFISCLIPTLLLLLAVSVCCSRVVLCKELGIFNEEQVTHEAGGLTFNPSAVEQTSSRLCDSRCGKCSSYCHSKYCNFYLHAGACVFSHMVSKQVSQMNCTASDVNPSVGMDKEHFTAFVASPTNM